MDEKINILINVQIENEVGHRELREQTYRQIQIMRETFREIRDRLCMTDESISWLERPH
jgi:hypothetical protein